MNTRVTVGLFAALALAALVFAGCGETAGSSDGANEIKPANNNPLGGGGSSIDGASGFQVIFDPQGGEWTVGDDDPYWEKAVNADGTVNLPDETLIRRNGMILLGWYDIRQPAELTPVKNRQGSEGDEETLDEEGGEPPASEAVSAGVEPPYLAADAEVPDGGIFTEGVILEKNTTLYAYWQELSPNAAIITFIPYWTSGAKGFKRQALAEKEYMLAEPLPLVTGGP
ncbi:MAG: hypothetical protein LBB22_00160, partial [Treponema sp.]|nr:hypothetical protein [Treponema sp.]